MCCQFTHPQAIRDVGDYIFFSWTVKKVFSWTVSGEVNGCLHFKSQKKQIRQHKINTHDSWWYIEVLQNESEHYLHYYYPSDKWLKVMYGSQTNHSFEPVLFSDLDELVHQIRLNHLTQSKLTFRLVSDSEWATIPVYLILWCWFLPIGEL